MPKERTLYVGDLGAVGVYRSGVDDPGVGLPFNNPLLVFPRTTVRLSVDRTREDAVIGPGCAVLYAAGDLSRVGWVDPVDRCDYLVPSPSLYDDVFGRAWEEPVHGATVVGADPALAVQMRNLIGGLMGGEHDALATEEHLASIVSNIGGALRCRPASIRARDLRLVDDIREAILDDPAGDWTLGGLAALVGASIGHVCRTFRRVTGQSVHQFRTAVRVLSSFDEIDGDLSAVAQRWGFSSHSHYTAVFTRWFGVTPAQARRHLRRQPPMDNGPWWRAANTSVVPPWPTSGRSR